MSFTLCDGAGRIWSVGSSKIRTHTEIVHDDADDCPVCAAYDLAEEQSDRADAAESDLAEANEKIESLEDAS